MKKRMRSGKGTLAIVLSVALFGTTAYGAQAPSTVEAAATQAEQTTPHLTYEEALKKAKNHSVDLRDLQKTTDFLQESKEDIWDKVGNFSVPIYDYQQWVNDAVFAYTSAIYTTDSSMTKNKYATQITNLALEATLKSTFSSIIENENNLKLLKETSEIQGTLYEQGKTKFGLGLISQYQLDQLKASYETSKTNVYQLERTLEQMYMNLNDLMGEAVDKKYTLEYEVEFEPYVLPSSMEAYINAALKKDYSILLKEQAIEDAKFKQNYLSEEDNSNNKSNKFSYESAQRELKAAKQDKEIAIRNAYVQLQQAEVNYNQAKADLALAQADLKTAEVNYKVGNITELTLTQAQLGVTQKELALEKIVFAYDMQVFTFKNTSLMSGSSPSSNSASAS
ncbi:outer membrane efflux protein [Anaerotignum neopropionicum]|uniref:Outer membrane efflux protein n=1 Tax=Anaerotignum neopropionicum TaxID=36847 RepID=A0A136WHP3_9FIRM|nr:TolC family protein [Anaerotignum neopropionicum]KXL54062.1 outer membrane efflux protein [Anaerotignum neopropionicum]